MKKRHRPTILTVLALLLLLLLAPAAAAGDTAPRVTVDPVGQSDNYSAVLYNNTNGLPTSETTDVAQTAEGFLWLGGYSGLIRYDGNTFERMDSTTGVGSVMCLFADSRDRLWIGTNENGLALMENGGYRIWGEEDGLGSAKIRVIAEDVDGMIYVGTTEGITMIEPDLTFHPVDNPKIASAYVEQIQPDRNGLLFCLTYEGDLFTLRGGELQDYIDHSEISGLALTAIYPDPAAPGIVYAGTEGSTLYCADLKARDGKLETVDISPLSDVQDMKRFGDQLWICALNGIGVLDGQGFHYLEELPMNNSVGHMMADYEGNLWFTSSRQGLMKLVSNRFSNLFERFNLQEQVVNATCLYGAELFVATDTGLLVLDGNGPVPSVPLTSAKTASGADLGSENLIELLDGCRIRSILRDSQGRMWLSTWRDLGLLRYDNGQLTAFTEADGMISNRVRAISEAPDGRIFVACTGGMNVIEGDRVTASYGEEEGIYNSVSLCVCAAPNGDAVLGSNGGGIYIIGAEGVRCIDTKDGLSSGVVMHIKYDAAREIYWLVTGNSLAWMSADYRVTTIQNFPYSDNSDLYENSKGDIWVLSSDGIYVLPAEELIANEEIKPVHYGIANGLPFVTTFNSYSELTPGGDLYMAGTAGVVKVNIESSLEDITDLKQAVPFVDADGVLLFPDETGAFSLSSKVKKLTIYPYVFNYSLTDPKVSFRLDGFEREDVTVSRSDLRPLTYTNLRGGTYHFLMELKDALGRGSRKLSVTIVKEKTVYEQVWFFCLAGVVTLLFLGTLNWMMIRQKTRAMEEKHRQEAERERLTNELNMAARIQARMLPNTFPAFPERSEFDIFASMEPAKEVGGDFYDFFMIDDDHLVVLMADVSGKGVPAALFMMTVRTMLKDAAKAGISPASVLEYVNAEICENNPEDMFVTVWMGILELSTGELIWADAGHDPLIACQDGVWKLLPKGGGIALGFLEPEFLEDNPPFRDHVLYLTPGDAVFQYTDGVTEAMTTELEQFGYDRLVAALNSCPTAGPETLLSHVREQLDAFVQGADQFDDITMLALRYRGPGGTQAGTSPK